MQKSLVRCRADLDVLSLVLVVSASFLCGPFASRCTSSPEHLLMYFFTRHCTGCMAWSPKKGTSVPGTFVLNVSRWNDHGEVWALRGDKRSRLWYVLRVRLPSDCPIASHPLCSLTTSACLNVVPGRKRRSSISKTFPGGWVEANPVFSLYRSMTPLGNMGFSSTSTTAEHTESYAKQAQHRLPNEQTTCRCIPHELPTCISHSTASPLSCRDLRPPTTTSIEKTGSKRNIPI